MRSSSRFRLIVITALVDCIFLFLDWWLHISSLVVEPYHAVGALRDCASSDDVALSQLTRLTAPKYRAMPRVNDFSVAERSLAALGVFEDQLERSATPFLADCGSPSYVDLAVFCELFELAEPGNVPDFAMRFALPRLGDFLGTMSERPRIAAYIQSPRRMPRYERPGYTYCPGKFSPKPEMEEPGQVGRGAKLEEEDKKEEEEEESKEVEEVEEVEEEVVMEVEEEEEDEEMVEEEEEEKDEIAAVADALEESEPENIPMEKTAAPSEEDFSRKTVAEELQAEDDEEEEGNDAEEEVPTVDEAVESEQPAPDNIRKEETVPKVDDPKSEGELEEKKHGEEEDWHKKEMEPERETTSCKAENDELMFHEDEFREEETKTRREEENPYPEVESKGAMEEEQKVEPEHLNNNDNHNFSNGDMAKEGLPEPEQELPKVEEEK